jgi:HSP20 family protein
MSLSALVPWGRNRNVQGRRTIDEGNAFLALHREIDRLFDDFFRDFDLPAAFRHNGLTGWPRIELGETDEAIKLVAELPGMEEKDIELTLRDGVLTITGEQKSENDGAVYSERWVGRFQRSVPVGSDVDPDKAKASFKNGVLTVVLPKRPEARKQTRSIPVMRG